MRRAAIIEICDYENWQWATSSEQQAVSGNWMAEDEQEQSVVSLQDERSGGFWVVGRKKGRWCGWCGWCGGGRGTKTRSGLTTSGPEIRRTINRGAWWLDITKTWIVWNVYAKLLNCRGVFDDVWLHIYPRIHVNGGVACGDHILIAIEATNWWWLISVAIVISMQFNLYNIN